MATKHHPDFKAAAKAADRAYCYELLVRDWSDAVTFGGQQCAHVVAFVVSRSIHWRNREAAALRGES